MEALGNGNLVCNLAWTMTRQEVLPRKERTLENHGLICREAPTCRVILRTGKPRGSLVFGGLCNPEKDAEAINANGLGGHVDIVCPGMMQWY